MLLPRALATSIDRIARQALGKDWSLYAALLDHWSEIVGTEYARVTTPVKITFPPRQQEAQRRGGTLVIRLPKGLAMEFSFKVAQIHERIRSYFGYDAITKIVFEPSHEIIKDAAPSVIPDPQALAAIHEGAKNIDNDELRNALEAFGASVLKSAKRRD